MEGELPEIVPKGQQRPNYLVEVYADDGRVETYMFHHRADVVTSINATWSKVRDTIEVMDVQNGLEDQIVVWALPTPHAKRRRVLYCRPVRDGDILTGPTHF